jgi:hypothetical protein
MFLRAATASHAVQPASVTAETIASSGCFPVSMERTASVPVDLDNGHGSPYQEPIQ